MLKTLELSGFKSFAKKTELEFKSQTTAIVGPNGSGKSNIAEAFRFDEATDTFDFTGNMTSYVLEFKIAPMLGIPGNKMQRMYAELDRRAQTLERIHKEKGVTDFYEVLDILSKAQQEGQF